MNRQWEPGDCRVPGLGPTGPCLTARSAAATGEARRRALHTGCAHVADHKHPLQRGGGAGHRRGRAASRLTSRQTHLVRVPVFHPMLATSARGQHRAGSGWSWSQAGRMAALVTVNGEITVRTPQRASGHGRCARAFGARRAVERQDRRTGRRARRGSRHAGGLLRAHATHGTQSAPGQERLSRDLRGLRPAVPRRPESLLPPVRTGRGGYSCSDLELQGTCWHVVDALHCHPLDALAACLELGLEGVVAERLYGLYRPAGSGRRTG